MVWWLFHCRYKSIWVGFLIDCCDEPAIIPKCYQNIQERHGSIWSGVFTCELNVMVNRVYMIQKLLFVSCFYDYKDVIYKSLLTSKGGVVMCLWLWSQSFPYKVLATMELIGEPNGSSFHLAHNIYPGKWNMCSSSQNSSRQVICFTVIDLLCWSSVSSSRSFLMMLSAGWMGTDGKSALTSYNMIISSELMWMPSRCCINYLLFWTWYVDFPTRGFRILDNSLDVLLCYSSYAGDNGSEWHPFLMHFRQPIELGGACPCGIEHSVNDISNPTLCLDGLEQRYQLVFVSGGKGLWECMWVCMLVEWQ